MPRSSYYHAALPTATQRSDEELGIVIEAIFRAHRGRYGYRRISADLAAKDITRAPERVRRIMRERGLKALQPKSFTPKTSDGRADRLSLNLLLDQPPPAAPDKVWAEDITYIPVGKGRLCPAVVIDLCSRKIVGWALAGHLRAGLVADALTQALKSRRPARGLLFHCFAPPPGAHPFGAAFGWLSRSARLRPRQPVRQRRIPDNPYAQRHPPEHVRESQSLSQRLDGVLHGHPEKGDAPRRTLP